MKPIHPFYYKFELNFVLTDILSLHVITIYKNEGKIFVQLNIHHWIINILVFLSNSYLYQNSLNYKSIISINSKYTFSYSFLSNTHTTEPINIAVSMIFKNYTFNVILACKITFLFFSFFSGYKPYIIKLEK